MLLPGPPTGELACGTPADLPLNPLFWSVPWAWTSPCSVNEVSSLGKRLRALCFDASSPLGSISEPGLCLAGIVTGFSV